MTREEQMENAAFDYLSNLQEAPAGMDELTEIFITAVKWADSHPAWRKCEDELPKNDDWVLVAYKPLYPIYDNGIRYELAQYWENRVWIGKRGEITNTQAIAWLPLPKFNPEND